MANPERVQLKICTYNVWLMPSLVTFFAHRLGLDVSPRKLTRAKIIAETLPEDIDVIILCEAFCTKATRLLCNQLKETRGFGYCTPVLGKTSKTKLLNGGVVVLSRLPIEQVSEKLFGAVCAGDDSLANKGILYSKLKLNETRYIHIFAAHTQAWDSPKCIAARARQLQMITEFVISNKISDTDPVLIAGDLNVPRDTAEYQEMIQTLNCFNPNQTDKLNPSFNHLANQLASKGPSSGGASATLDYILVSNGQAQPTAAHADVLPLKSAAPFFFKGKSLNDLSDHYPVVARFVF